MTREEELDWLCRLRSEIYVYMPKEWLIPMNNALDMAISALSENKGEWINAKAGKLFPSNDYKCSICGNAVLDEIRAEIDQLPLVLLAGNYHIDKDSVMQILDKYRVESEDT